MFILITTLIGIGLGWFLASRMHMDEIETITSVCFGTVGAWLGAIVSEYPLDPRRMHEYDALSLILTIAGTALAVMFYKIVFHPHREGHFHPWDYFNPHHHDKR